VKRAALLAIAACGAPARPAHVATPTPRASAEPWIDLRLGDPTWHVPGSVEAIAWTRDERRVVIGSHEGGVLIYDLASGAASTRIAVGGTLERLSLADDEHALASVYLSDGDHDEQGVIAVDLRARATERTSIDATEALALPGDAGEALAVQRDPGGLAIVDRATGDVKRTLDQSTGWVEPRIVGGRVVARHLDTIGVWDLASGARLARFGSPRLDALSPDGALIAAGSYQDAGAWQVDVYGVADGKRLRSFSHGACDPARGAFSPDGRLLATTCDDGLRVWEVATGAQLAAVSERLGYTSALAFSPTGRWLAAGGNDDIVHVWDTSTWRELDVGDAHAGQVTRMQVAPDGAHLLTMSFVDGTARVWDVASGRSTVMAGDGGLTAAGFAGKGVLIGRSRDMQAAIEQWPADGRGLGRSIPLASSQLGPPIVRGLDGHRDGRIAAVYGAEVHVFDASAAAVWASHRTNPDDLGNGEAVFTDDGAKVAIEDQDRILTVVDLDARTQRDVGVHACSGPDAFAWTRDGAQLAVADDQGAVRLIDVATDRVTGGVVLPVVARALGTTRDGHLIALGDGHVYDAAPDGKVTRLPAPDASTLAVSPDGASIYVGRTDGTIARIDRAKAAGAAEPVAASRAEDVGECEGGEGGWGIGGTYGGTPRGKIDDNTPDRPGQTWP
jgi:WD40 repeat protein